MDNEIIWSGTFNDYVDTIKELYLKHCKLNDDIGKSIRECGITYDGIESNTIYLRECYDSMVQPENVLKNIKYNTDELFRKLEDISDDELCIEIESRGLINTILSEISTDDIERELEDRWDRSDILLSDATREELLGRLGIEESDIIHDETVKEVICKVLGFPNAIAYDVNDIIEVLKTKVK